MLCPNCGVDVGDTLTLCVECEARRAVHQGNVVQQEQQAGVYRPYGQTDLLTQMLNFFSTPFGMILGGSVLFLLLVVATLFVFPDKGVIEAAILSTIYAGLGCMAAGPYMFAFDSGALRKIATRLAGAMILALGLFLYGAYTGKSISEVYVAVQEMLHSKSHSGRTTSPVGLQ